MRKVGYVVEGNHLLDMLNAQDRKTLARIAAKVRFETGAVLHEPDDPIGTCYFPVHSAVVALFVKIAPQQDLETLLIGDDGAFGAIFDTGILPSFTLAKVVHGGEFYRLSPANVQTAKERIPRFRRLLSHYTEILVTQILQAAACNAAHSIEQRTARWLCNLADLTDSQTLHITQEQLSSLIGSGRSYASRVIQRFKRDGLVTTRRGSLQIHDLDGLRSRACHCSTYVERHTASVRRHFEQTRL